MDTATVANFVSMTGLGAGAATLSTIAYGIFNPSSSLLCPVVLRSRGASAGELALTFDDGPLPGSTDQVLDVLAAFEARATFFVIGARVQRFPDLLRRIHAEGHVIGNHTMNHSYRGCFGWWQAWERDIRLADDAVESITGVRPAFFRPPMGFKTWHLARAVRRTGHRVVGWSRRALDGAPTTPDRILRRLAPAGTGEILALHDGCEPWANRSTRATLEALPRVLESFASRGVRSVTLERLLVTSAYARPVGVAASIQTVG